VKKVVDAAGGWGAEFNTIAIDDGIAMGHTGMLYSLPSRDLIADSVEYMVNAHCVDAMCASATATRSHRHDDAACARTSRPSRLGGPMEAGTVAGPQDRDGKPTVRKLDLIDTMTAASDQKVSEAELALLERSACPTCGSCSGMFTPTA